MLDVCTVVDSPGIVVILGTCDDGVGAMEAVVATVKTIDKHNKNYIFV